MQIVEFQTLLLRAAWWSPSPPHQALVFKKQKFKSLFCAWGWEWGWWDMLIGGTFPIRVFFSTVIAEIWMMIERRRQHPKGLEAPYCTRRNGMNRVMTQSPGKPLRSAGCPAPSAFSSACLALPPQTLPPVIFPPWHHPLGDCPTSFKRDFVLQINKQARMGRMGERLGSNFHVLDKALPRGKREKTRFVMTSWYHGSNLGLQRLGLSWFNSVNYIYFNCQFTGKFSHQITMHVAQFLYSILSPLFTYFELESGTEVTM